MSFQYDISDTTDISSMMRLEIGDIRHEDGILPEGRNFSDEELDHFYDQEDDDFWLAVGRTFDAAAAQWAPYPTSFRMGPEEQKMTATAYYSMRAKNARSIRQGPGVYVVEKSEYAMDV
jgi:hypothetical protein